MAESKDKIIADIKGHIAKCGGSYSEWYAGITEDAKQRVFNGHGVVKGKDPYIWRRAVSSAVARQVEARLLELGCDGGGGGGDEGVDFAYAYKKSSRTDP